MVEIGCEDYGTCTTDMLSFKGYVHRWMATMTKVAPYTAATVLPVLQKSAAAAAAQCTGGDTKRACGFKWKSGTFDGSTGAGQEMNVLGAISSLLIDQAKPPLTAETGGTSKGNVNAGQNSDDFQQHDTPVSTGDRAGAGILTFIVLASACGMFGWISLGS